MPNQANAQENTPETCACATDQRPNAAGRQVSIGNARPPRGWLQTLITLPAAILPVLPSFTCPFCVAAYAGVLSTFGLGFLLKESVLAPLIVVFLLVGIATVAWTTRSHRRPGPLAATIVGSLLVVAGRLIWDVPTALYAGIAFVIGASLWNLWLKRRKRAPLMQTMAPQTTTL